MNLVSALSSINLPKSMTSLQITNAVSENSDSAKTHSNVLKKIRKLLEDLDLQESDYIPDWTRPGQKDFMLVLPLELATMVLSEYNKKYGYAMTKSIMNANQRHTQAVQAPAAIPQVTAEDIAGSLIHDFRGSLKLLLSEVIDEGRKTTEPEPKTYLTVTQLGRLVGRTGSEINNVLVRKGFQVKIATGYLPTPRAQGLHDSPSVHGSGISPRKFGWLEEVLDYTGFLA